MKTLKASETARTIVRTLSLIYSSTICAILLKAVMA
jgi:hypothetical protein